MKLIAKDLYFGWIVEEGLINPFSLTELKIAFTNVRLEKGNELIYHVYSVTMTGKEVEKLTKLIHHKYHYAKFFHNNEIIIVYPNKIFIVDHKTKQGLKEAQVYGKKLKIGKAHIDNILDPSVELYFLD